MSVLYKCADDKSGGINNVTLFSHDIMHYIKEPSVNGETLKRIDLTALRGEYEPFSFSVKCSRVCRGLVVTVSALSKDGYTEIGNEEININQLIKGKALYGVEDWILRSVENEAAYENRFVYFWITIHVPEYSRPGKYRSILTVTPKEGKPISVPVELTVLREMLEDPHDVQFAMLYTISPFGEYFDPDKYNELAPTVLEFYRELRNHGMTAISPKNSDWPYRKGDIDGLRAETRLAAQAGFKGPVLWYMSSLINGAKCGKRYTHYDGNCSGWDEFRDITNLRDIVAYVKEAEKKENWPEVIFITVDEPGTVSESPDIRNLRMTVLEKTMKEVQKLGARGATTVTEPVDNRHNIPPFVNVSNDMRRRWDRVRPYCAVRIYGYGYPEGITNLFAEKLDAERRGHEMWFYNNTATMGDNRYMARVFYGLWGWKVGARGLASWTYPGMRTVQWELVREGIDDHKYLRIIKALSEKLPYDNRTRLNAETFLQETFDSIELDSNGYIKNWNKWENFDFKKFRERAANIINLLSR